MDSAANYGMQIGGEARVHAGALAGGVGAQAHQHAAPVDELSRALDTVLRLIEEHRSELAEPALVRAEVEVVRAELQARHPDRDRVLAALQRTAAHVGAVGALAVAVQQAASAVLHAVGG